MHLLDVEQRRNYLHEAKLQAKVEVVAYKSEATNEKKFNLLQQQDRDGLVQQKKVV